MSLPQEFIASLRGLPGFDESPFVAVHALGHQVNSVRLNPAKPFNLTTHQPFQVAGQVPWCPQGLYLAQRPLYTFDPLLHAGAYYVQEASSMFVWHALGQVVNSQAGLRVLDLCAAPGGKSTLLASLLPNSLVVSNEVIRSRAAVLAENITKWGSDNVVVTSNDPSAFSPLTGYFDLVVVDAPCSGSGLFRKDPEAIHEWSPAAVDTCSRRQQRILDDVLPSLRENGILLYSTCSYAREENEDMLRWLVHEQDMETLPLSVPAEWGIVEVREEGCTGYRFYPHRLQGEGFFLAVLRKKAAAPETYATGTLPEASRSETALLQPWVAAGDYRFFKNRDALNALRAGWWADVALLQKQLYIRRAGIPVGVVKGRDLVPAHDLALSALVHPDQLFVELNETQAMQYLRKQDIEYDFVTRGWTLVRYKAQNLGWLKVLPNRVNNYYPVEWRVLKT